MKPLWPEQSSQLTKAIGDFVSERIYDRPGAFKDFTALGVFKDKTLVAGMIYYDYDQTAEVIQISGAADTARWLTKPILWEMFAFPFIQLGCQAVVMRVDPKDDRLRRILTAYGFEEYTIPRLRGREQAETIYLLGDDVWRSNGFHKEFTNGKKSA